MMMGHGMSVLLVTSAVGYWTLTAAGREKGRVKTLGQYLGLIIVVLSLASAACKVYCMVTSSSCPMVGGMSRGMGKSCPFTGKPVGSQPAQ